MKRQRIPGGEMAYPIREALDCQKSGSRNEIPWQGLGTGGKRATCGRFAEGESDPQVGGLTSTAHGSVLCDDQTDRIRGKRAACGRFAEGESDPLVGGLTSTAHSSVLCDDQTDRIRGKRGGLWPLRRRRKRPVGGRFDEHVAQQCAVRRSNRSDQSPNVPNGEAVSIQAMPPKAASHAASDPFGFFDRLEPRDASQ